MDQNMKKELEAYFQAPKPQNKKAFIHSIKPKKISTLHILLTQFTYISKITWCFSFLFFAISLLLGSMIPNQLLGLIYSFIPFLVMISIIECIRSSMYGMNELEMTTQFSLKSILMIRICILGITNIALLIFIVMFNHGIKWHSLFYMFVPYFITAFGSFKILRTIHSKESTFYCAGFAGFISILCFITYERYQFIYQLDYLSIWIIACVILLCLIVIR